LEDLKGVVVIGATNRPDILDEALLRPGRFDRILEVPLPDKESRKDILKIHTKRKPLDNTVDMDKIVELTGGFTGADIAAIVNAAAMSAIKEYVATINENNKVRVENKTADPNTTPNTTVKGEGDKSQDKQKEDKRPGLKITMKHFESALQKIKRKTTAINNPSLV
jgi:transitional endoplasmic reticulum ATPase